MGTPVWVSLWVGGGLPPPSTGSPLEHALAPVTCAPPSSSPPASDTAWAASLAWGDTLLLGHFAVGESLEVYRGILKESPEAYEALWRSARGYLALAILEDEWAVKEEWFREGVAHAREALRVCPDSEVALYWLMANLGRWAQKEGDSRKALEMAGEVRALAEHLLQLDDEHAGAHNVLGMFHLEVLRKSRTERVLGRLLSPSTLRGVSWAEAEEHLRRATVLDPASVLYQRDLADALLWHGDIPAALEVLRQVILLPPILPTDPKFLLEVHELRRRADMEG